MPVAINEIKAQLSRLGDLSWEQNNFKKEFAYLPEVIQQGEIIQAIASGAWNGKLSIIVVTQRRVLFIYKGILYGLEQSECPMREISKIHHKIGLIAGEIQISTSGGNLLFTNIPKHKVPGLVRTLEQLIHDSEKTNIVATPSFQSSTAPTTVREKETIIKEIVYIRCSHCGSLSNQTDKKCSNCGASL
ncbi:MAG: PH domain-containing protein [Candidatus Thermoplasmatota archaeon]